MNETRQNEWAYPNLMKNNFLFSFNHYFNNNITETVQSEGAIA